MLLPPSTDSVVFSSGARPRRGEAAFALELSGDDARSAVRSGNSARGTHSASLSSGRRGRWRPGNRTLPLRRCPHRPRCFGPSRPPRDRRCTVRGGAVSSGRPATTGPAPDLSVRTEARRACRRPKAPTGGGPGGGTRVPPGGSRWREPDPSVGRTYHQDRVSRCHPSPGNDSFCQLSCIAVNALQVW